MFWQRDVSPLSNNSPIWRRFVASSGPVANWTAVSSTGHRPFSIGIHRIIVGYVPIRTSWKSRRHMGMLAQRISPVQCWLGFSHPQRCRARRMVIFTYIAWKMKTSALERGWTRQTLFTPECLAESGIKSQRKQREWRSKCGRVYQGDEAIQPFPFTEF